MPSNQTPEIRNATGDEVKYNCKIDMYSYGLIVAQVVLAMDDTNTYAANVELAWMWMGDSDDPVKLLIEPALKVCNDNGQLCLASIIEGCTEDQPKKK